MSHIDTETVKIWFEKGKEGIKQFSQDVYIELEDRIFQDALEIGIENTIAALYEADVDDNKIISLLNVFWGINARDATDRLSYEKQNAPRRKLEQYMKLQGYTSKEIDCFISSHAVGIKLRHDPKLRALWRKPEELMKAVQKADK